MSKVAQTPSRLTLLLLVFMFCFSLFLSGFFGLFLTVFFDFLRVDPWLILSTLFVFLGVQVGQTFLMRALFNRILGRPPPNRLTSEDRIQPTLYFTSINLGLITGFSWQIIKFGAFQIN